ncbi:MAG TPA: 3-dehydroquinate synthase [Negativicutes bacterium]|jgi:3-dehydroquinate synthase
MAKFSVALRKIVDDSYDVEIGRNLFPVLIDDLKNGLVKDISKIVIISDSIVKDLYGNALLQCLQDNNFNADIITFPAGEKNKTRETKALLEDKMLEKAYGRDSCIVALGGGTVTDLAGFLAGTFGRGIPFVNYATTLLAAADASIGGKTAVDTPIATNLIGLFNQPAKVYIDLDTWATLPVREVHSGLAETIKHACIADYSFFEYLEQNIDRIVTADRQCILDKLVCEHIAFKNCEIKYNVITMDEKENNFRQILNLGHTVGRAVETLSNYNLLHGEAVAIGLVVQALIGKKLNFISESELRRIINIIKWVGLPIDIPKYISTRELVNKLYTDKKVRKGQIRFVFQDGIGKIKQFKDNSYALSLNEDFIIDTLNEVRVQR